MQLQSIITTRGQAVFPAYRGDRIYMQPFYKKTGLSRGYDHWQPTVDAMLDGIDVDGPIYLMVDESTIKSGQTQRRKGLHVDGYWNPAISAHGTDYGGSGHTSQGGHRPIPRGGHNPTYTHAPTPSRHAGSKTEVPSIYDKDGKLRRRENYLRDPGRGGGSHVGSPPVKYHNSGASLWSDAKFEEAEGIILASSLSAAHGWKGPYEGPVGEGGDCSHIALNNLIHVPMDAGQVYAGNVCCLHESLPVYEDSIRQLVRLNVPGWTPNV